MLLLTETGRQIAGETANLAHDTGRSATPDSAGRLGQRLKASVNAVPQRTAIAKADSRLANCSRSQREVVSPSSSSTEAMAGPLARPSHPPHSAAVAYGRASEHDKTMRFGVRIDARTVRANLSRETNVRILVVGLLILVVAVPPTKAHAEVDQRCVAVQASICNSTFAQCRCTSAGQTNDANGVVEQQRRCTRDCQEAYQKCVSDATRSCYR